MIRTSVVAIVLLFVTACPAPSGQCTSSAQCPTSQSCVSGACVGGTTSGGSAGTGGGSTGTGGGTAATGGGGSSSTAGGSSGTSGESCTMAQTVTGSMTLSGTTVGAMADVNLSCTGSRNQGPDRVYVVTVPNLQRLTVTLTPEETDTADGGLQFDPSLYLVAGPAAACSPADAGDRTSCLDGSDIDQPAGSPERVAYLNTSGAPREVFVVVDSFFTAPDETNGTTHEGKYDLSFTVATPPVGDRCESASTVTPGMLSGQSLDGYSGDYGFGTNCRRSDGPDRTYALTVPAGQRLTAIAATANDAGFDVTLNVIAGPAASCEASPLVCLIGSDALGLGGTERVDYLNRGTTPQKVFVVVGSYDPTDTVTDFSLATSVAMPPAGDECASAVTLTAGTPLVGETFNAFGNDYGSGSGCGFTSSGPDRVYTLTIPPNKLATITATPTAGLNTSVSLIDGAANCATGMLRCVATSTGALATDPDVVTWTNRTSAPQTLLVLVDSSAPGSGLFDLAAVITDPPAGDSCSNPTTLASGASVASTTIGFTNDYAAGATTTCATFDTSGPDRVFSFNVPTGQRAKVTVSSATDGGYVPSVSLVTSAASACEAAPRVCAASANSSSLGTARSASFVNGSGQAQSGFAIVDGQSGAGTNFTIALATATPIADDVCATATTTLGTTALTAQTLRPGGVTFERDYTCVSNSRGVDRVYVAQAQPNQRLTVTVTPTPAAVDGGFDPVLSLIAGPAAACDSATRRCLAARDVGARLAPETASFTNVGSVAQPLFVVVGSFNETDTDTLFSLQATSAAIPPGEVCENAQAITSGMALPAETLTSFSRDYALSSTSCSLSSAGTDRVYSISVGANQTLTVRGVPDAMADIVLNVIEGPAANCNAAAVTCLASADRGSDGQEDRLTWTNSTTAAKTVFVVVSSYRSGPMTYSLEVTVQ